VIGVAKCGLKISKHLLSEQDTMGHILAMVAGPLPETEPSF